MAKAYTSECWGDCHGNLYCNGKYSNGMAIALVRAAVGYRYDDAAADSTGLRPNRRGKGVLPTILTAQFVGIALQNSMAALIGGITK